MKCRISADGPRRLVPQTLNTYASFRGSLLADIANASARRNFWTAAFDSALVAVFQTPFLQTRQSLRPPSTQTRLALIWAVRGRRSVKMVEVQPARASMPDPATAS